MPGADAQRRATYTRWALIAFTLVLGAALFAIRGGPPKAGDVIRLPFTLKPSDRYMCQCAQDEGKQPDHGCQFTIDGQGRVVPARLPRPSVWTPHWTTDRMVYVVEGLWSDPEVLRAVEELKALPVRDQRFVAACDVELIRWLPDGKVRESMRAKWDPHIPNWLVRVVRCDAE